MFAKGDIRAGARLGGAIWTLLLLVVLAGPLVALGLDLVLWMGSGETGAVANIIAFDRQGPLLLKSVSYAASVTGGAALIAIGAASLIWTWNIRASRIATLALLSMIAIPPYLHALAWQSLTGLVNDLSGLARFRFAGWGAAWWSQMMAMTPVATGLALLGLFSVDRAHFETGRLVAADFTVFNKVILPLAAAPLLAAIGIVFLYTLVDYSVPSTFQRNTYALEIFAEFSVSHNAALAALIALPLLVVSFAVLGLVLWQARRITLGAPMRNSWQGSSPAWPGWVLLAQGVAFALLALQFLALVVGLGSLADPSTLFIAPIAGAASEISRTFWTSALAAVLGLALAFVAARRIAGGGWIWLIPVLLPIAVPGSLMGIGLISLWNTPATARVYDSAAILVLSYLARFVPVATLVLVARFRRIDWQLIDAARVQMPSPFRAWVQVYIPLFAKAGAVSMFLVFVLSVAELSATILTMPPGGGTMAVRIFNYLHYGASDVVAYLSFVIPIMAILFAATLFLLARAWRLFLPRHSKDTP